MKLYFNDATHIEIDRADHKGGQLIFKVTRPEHLSEYFTDENKTRRMVVKRDDEVLFTFEGFTTFYGITECSDGSFDVIMYKEGLTPEERISFLEEDVETQGNVITGQGGDIQTCYEAIAELSELIVG